MMSEDLKAFKCFMFKEEIEVELDRLCFDKRKQEFPWHGLSRKGYSTNSCSLPFWYQRYCVVHFFFQQIVSLEIKKKN